MKKSRTIFFIVCIFALSSALSSCNGIIKEKLKEDYISIDGGYALNRFEGGSHQLSYTILDTYKDEPVIELKKFSVANAEYLEVLNIGKNIKVIDSWAIVNCQKLKAINVAPDNENFCSVDGVLYTKDKKTLLAYPNYSHGVEFNNLGDYKTYGSYEILEGTEIISERAFYKCYGLGNITLPQSVIKILEGAFLRCQNLNNVTLPKNLEVIGKDSFSFCYKFDKMFIPSSVIEIGDYAFFCVNNVKVFEMGRESSDGMTLSENWLPVKQKEGSLINEKAKVIWGVVE